MEAYFDSNLFSSGLANDVMSCIKHSNDFLRADGKLKCHWFLFKNSDPILRALQPVTAGGAEGERANVEREVVGVGLHHHRSGHRLGRRRSRRHRRQLVIQPIPGTIYVQSLVGVTKIVICFEKCARLVQRARELTGG